MILDLDVELFVQLVDLLILSIQIELSGSELVSELVYALFRVSHTLIPDPVCTHIF